MKNVVINLSALVILCGPLSAVAMPLYSEGFESYAAGTVLHNVGGWKGWDNVPAVAGVVSDAFARSGSNSVEILGNRDAVHPFSGITSGSWTLTAWQYLPSAPNNDSIFIVNNVYNDGGPYEWTVELRFDSATTNVLDDFRAENVVPMIFNQWVEIRNVIDLDANTVESYYNNSLVSSGAYTVRGGPAEIATIDLFSEGGVAYYDDISLSANVNIPEPATLALLGFGLAGLGLSRRKKVQAQYA